MRVSGEGKCDCGHVTDAGQKALVSLDDRHAGMRLRQQRRKSEWCADASSDGEGNNGEASSGTTRLIFGSTVCCRFDSLVPERAGSRL